MSSLATTERNPFSIRPREAWVALKALLADPEATHHVFTIVRALSGKTLLRGFNRFSATATGRRVLDEQRNLVLTLQNRSWLSTLPEGSLGRAYLNFVETEQLTADGLVEASESGDPILSPALARYGERLRDQHDLWHVSCGYGRDVAGEASLLALTVAQTRNPGLALIAVAGMLKIARQTGDRGIFSAVIEGFRNGRRMAWLPAVDWEAELARPLDRVRDDLGIREPRAYQDFRDQLPVEA